MSGISDLASLSTTHLSGAAAGPSTIPGTVGRRRRRGIDSAPERLTVKVGRRIDTWNEGTSLLLRTLWAASD